MGWVESGRKTILEISKYDTLSKPSQEKLNVMYSEQSLDQNHCSLNRSYNTTFNFQWRCSQSNQISSNEMLAMKFHAQQQNEVSNSTFPFIRRPICIWKETFIHHAKYFTKTLSMKYSGSHFVGIRKR